ncbi:TQXA domain-containing protein [Mycobacterium heidelbergense]|uniref:TQXA domain-containing protein n=1 Tax=Mycobacterium heidelbergense TaxID=53376 RepID=A0A1X0DCT6_MYCHE|nr:TQXA domain-containing protein [Mycobacterium heidelbergense]MCV7052037.1 TQXA domain-containing protein [Mycobacterium heidelbergense]ORA70148.1 TQXA domain-containing protein [Mycobacterium heidelbergense]BBZ51951.1 TQXA domain-containing protein [Mycobacterium heidelbergense]
MTVLSMPHRAPARVATRRRILVRPATDVTQMTRYRGGTYSHTVDTIVFADGSSARTDLIRVNPNLRAYSLDFTGVAPHHPSRYRLGTWSALPHLRARGHEAEVDWILRHSFPMRTIADLSQRLRAAGYPLGAANISEHEAIAATQAAIWHFTNGLALDTRPLNVPIAVRRGPGPVITFEFDGHPQLGGYSLWANSNAAVELKLQKSANGVDWQDVSGSRLTTDAGRGRYQRTLGVGSTLSAASHGGGGRGYRHYRLIAATDAAARAIGDVRFWLTGASHYRNADRVVHLYNYLLIGASNALRSTDELHLVESQATAEPKLIGPFQVPIPLRLSVTDGHTLVGANGLAIRDTVHPGTDFYLRPAPGTSATTMTATTPHGLTGRVLTGVAQGGAPHRFTPIALTVPTDVAIEFDITWQADEPCTEIA